MNGNSDSHDPLVVSVQDESIEENDNCTRVHDEHTSDEKLPVKPPPLPEIRKHEGEGHMGFLPFRSSKTHVSEGIDPLSRKIIDRSRSRVDQPDSEQQQQQSSVFGNFLSVPGTHRRQASQKIQEIDESGRNDAPISLKDFAGNSNNAVDNLAAALEPTQVGRRPSLLQRIFRTTRRLKPGNANSSMSKDDESCYEGNSTLQFSDASNKLLEEPGRYVRVRSKNKSKKDFSRLFLAQEFDLSRLTAFEGSDLMPYVTNISFTCSNSAMSPVLPSVSRTLSENLSSPLQTSSRRGSIRTNGTGTSSRAGTKTGAAIWAMEFSHDGKYLAVGGQDRTIRVWTVYNEEQEKAFRQMGHTSASKSVNGTLHAPVFSTRPVREYVGHKSDILDLCWSKNNFLLSSSMDRTVRLWHPSGANCLCCFEHSDFVTSIAFHPKDDRFFLSGSLDCRLRLWSITDKSVTYWNELPELITAVAFTPDGSVSIAGTFGGLCLFYDTKGLRYRTQMPIKDSRGRTAKGSKITGIEARMLASGVKGETQLLITTNDSRIRVYNIQDKSLEYKLKGHVNEQGQIKASFSDDMQHVICGSEDDQVYVWDVDAYRYRKKKSQQYEHFKASLRTVTVAIFAPTWTKRLLAEGSDPIYGLPRASGTRESRIITDQVLAFPHETTSEFSNGHIIVCGDVDGVVRVFRQDSAFDQRQAIAIQKKQQFQGINASVQNLKRADPGTQNSNIPQVTIQRSKSSMSLQRDRPTTLPYINAKLPQAASTSQLGLTPALSRVTQQATHSDVSTINTQARNARTMNTREALRRADVMLLQEGPASMAYYALPLHHGSQQCNVADKPEAYLQNTALYSSNQRPQTASPQGRASPSSNLVKGKKPLNKAEAYFSMGTGLERNSMPPLVIKPPSTATAAVSEMNLVDKNKVNYAEDETQFECSHCGNDTFRMFTKKASGNAKERRLECCHCNQSTPLLN
ncbi:WDR44 family WD repeat protein [Schizosaccharomyces japonicus yFS275]|uniref:WDR44 family WD repeat protein n=1 Tax=Schizosaccharomyces japonicus (strain yFS275 / FY16936) TaxID=402676 RepID=B6JYA2_SCHJY|nr:WDR44 family WD repeat protein [Schizosaccharomyces japonicus yFS275]EEB06520.1 WDR44 family WD repeat protein [Schizosaccharomyces japonicus yFS275]